MAVDITINSNKEIKEEKKITSNTEKEVKEIIELNANSIKEVKTDKTINLPKSYVLNK